MGCVKLGIVGAGWIAQTYAKAALALSDVSIVGVMDTNAGAAAQVAAELQCTGFSSLEDMVRHTALDGVVICTPPATHREIALFFLKRGVNVLCEKPLTIDIRSAETMLEAALASKCILTMASKFRFVEDVIKTREILASGKIGDVLLFRNAFLADVDMTNRWNSSREMSGGGVLIDNGTHSVDIMRYLFGAIAHVKVLEDTMRRRGLPVEETVRMLVRTEEGVVGRIDLSWSTKSNLEHYIIVQGGEGSLAVGWKESSVRLGGEKQVFGSGYDKHRAFQNQLRSFAANIRGEEPLRVTPEDMIASVRVIEAGYASLRSGTWVTVSGQREIPHGALEGLATGQLQG